MCLEQEYVWYKKRSYFNSIALSMKYISIMIFENKWSLFVLNIEHYFLAIGYIAAFSLIFIHFSKMKIFKWFENVGENFINKLYYANCYFCMRISYWAIQNLDSINLIFVAFIIYSIQCFISSLFLRSLNMDRWRTYFENGLIGHGKQHLKLLNS